MIEIIPTFKIKRLLFVMITLLSSTFVFSQATLTSDEPDYAPGTTATFTGAGFLPNEIVQLVVHHYDGIPNDGENHDSWLVEANSNGDFITTWHVCEDDCINSTLIATADGQTSGLHAEVIFTDAPRVNTVSLNPTSSNVCIPSSGSVTKTYIVSATRGQNGTVNGVYSITTALPTGVTASFSPSSFTSNGGSVFPSSTLTFTILSSASSQNLSFTVRCANGTADIAETNGVLNLVLPPLPTFSAPLADVTLNCGNPIPSLSNLSYSNQQSGECLVSGSVISTRSSQIPSGACGGIITETWNATDSYGRTILPVSRKITILPAALPVMVAPSDLTVACGSLPSASTLNYSNGLSGGCEISGVSNASSFSAVPNACGGDITETWTAADSCGRALTSVSRTIHVLPAALPVMVAPSDITVACGNLPTTSTLNYSNGSSGGCEISGVSNASSFSAVPNACGGDVTETWTATDSCGRALTSVSRTIHVLPAALPVMVAPSDITVACGNLPTTSTLNYSNGSSGGCEISGVSNASSFSAVPNACGGDVTETWTATDSCGRALTSVSRTIHVLPAALPVMVAPSDITVACGSLPSASTLNYSNGLSGGCEISGVSNASSFSAVPNACGGDITETWTATDSCGRALTSVSRTIHVLPAALPVMVAPSDITVACGSLPSASTLNYSNGLSGNCEISGVSNASSFSAVPNACGGDITETWIATDSCGRALTSVSRTIHVLPTALPVFASVEDITVSCGQLVPHSLNYSNGQSGTCYIGGSVTSTFLSSIPNCGDVIESWKVIDTCGRLVSTSRVVHIIDNIAPVITNCPSNITLNPNTSGCSVSLANYVNSIAVSDNCSSVTVSQSPLPGTKLNLGANLITLTAADECGNSNSCQFTISVVSNLVANCTNTNNELYFGYSGDQSSVFTVTPSGGVGPYNVKIELSRALKCNQVNDSGDESFTGGAGGITINNTCPAFPNQNVLIPSSTKTINSGSFSVNVLLMYDADLIATITDSNGCVVSCSKHIHAEDVRCFAGSSGRSKVTICHQTGSNKNPCVKICVDDDTVSEHLAHGDFVGNCTPNCIAPVSSKNESEQIIVDEKFSIKVYPNPSKNNFSFEIETSSEEIVSVYVFDLFGRKIRQYKNESKKEFLIGDDLPIGVYLATIEQGQNKKTIRIIKE